MIAAAIADNDDGGKLVYLCPYSMLFPLSKSWVNIPVLGSSWRRSRMISPLKEQSCPLDIPKYSGGLGFPLFSKRQFL